MLNKVKEYEKYIVDLRRYFHENPELSGQEFNTKRVVVEELQKLGIEIKEAGNASVIGILKGYKKGKTVALRADMDALPIIEQSGVEFSSKTPGIMHACGHDAHTAMLLGAAKILSEMKEEIPGEIRFFFQEGEETFTGAKKIIEVGGMNGVDACLGMHGMPELKTGYVNIQSGYRMAGCDTIYVKFEGVSGHGSVPHLAKDTIHPACAFVTDLQGIVTKNINAQDPIVISVGKFVGGTKANVVAKYTEIDISMRYFNPQVREIAHEAIRRHAKAIADAYELKAEVRIEESALSLYNDDELSILADDSAAKVFGEGKNKTLPRYMGSEDMPYYFKHAKGVYAFLGYRNEEKEAVYFPHHEKFKIDEDYLKYGTALHVQFALDFLSK
ncbi:carboxypeptidase [Clostridium carboxidivorans P7]|uniref:Amidohydrolase n=1 Tax=Clostridium carboxidivorans P7 TaxID=536227 RepID=C6PZL3_9CLOT|nr:amidohydrolase [Clostridium carboxidivorans]AKN31878.1 carboxypeptidase [Clostridium carboxidivorans P7]EET85325.1 amidohydrolase [Clostridium carboxidivorans P7]